MAYYQSMCQSVQDLLHKGTALTITTPIKLRLFSTTSTATAVGTELSTASGYTAGGTSITFSTATAATPSVSANSGIVQWTNMPAVTVNGVDTVDSTGTPIKIEFGALTAAKTTALGDTLSFAVSAYQSGLS
jgi:hypothetical protein